MSAQIKGNRLRFCFLEPAATHAKTSKTWFNSVLFIIFIGKA
jgi:hypothetical protein